MTAHLGTDLAWVDGDLTIDATGDLVLDGGVECLLTDLAHRLDTWRGSYFRHPTAGMDWAEHLQAEADTNTRLALAQALVRELEEDPRVEPGSASVTVVLWDLERIKLAGRFVPIETGHELNLVIGFNLVLLTAEVARA